MQRLNLLFPYILFVGVAAPIALSNLPAGQSSRPTTQDHTTSSSIEPEPPPARCDICRMEVDPATALTRTVNGQPHFYCSNWCLEHDRASQTAGDDTDRVPAAEPAPDAVTRTTAAPDAPAVHAKKNRLVDVVCNMEVNAKWGITARHGGQTFHFCTPRCREQFLLDPERFLTEKCLVCDTPLAGNAAYTATYLNNTYRFCSEDHRAEFKKDPAAYFLHSMWGIPSWLYFASIAIILVLSFGLFEWLGRLGGSNDRTPNDSAGPIPNPPHVRRPQHGSRFEPENPSAPTPLGTGAAAVALPVLGAQAWSVPQTHDQPADRFDLMSVAWIAAALRSRPFRWALQAVVVVAFFLIIAAGLFGNQNPALNIAPILTWTIWWALLIVLILYAGKSWCYVCPWDAVAGWTERLSFWKKRDIGLSLNLKWPRAFRNILIATLFFVGLTWIELGFGVTMKPRVTAYLALGMLFMAVASALLFEKKSFCRYACLVGRVSGLYALFSSTEIRSKSASVCKACSTKECIKGSESAYGCPTLLYPGKLKENTYCIQCMECIQACPHDNLAVNLRPWGSDLAAEGKPRTDEAYLALLMLAITGFHGLTMTPAWQRLIDGIRAATTAGRLLGFTLAMAILMLAPIGIYALLIAASKALGDAHATKPLRYRDYFIRYAYALLPIALFYHIAHNSEHLLMEGPKIIAMISDPFGWGWNLFGTASWTIPPLVSLQMLWLVQVFLVLVGHVYSLWVAQKTSRRLFGSTRAAFRSQIPMLIGMICFSVFSLWLLKQPMEMRTSAM